MIRRKAWKFRALAATAMPLLTIVALLLACGPRAVAVVPYDLQFIDAMTAHHRAAIEMAAPAQSNAMHPELRDFAGRVIEDQSREVALMAEWRGEWFAGRPLTPTVMGMPGMPESMRGMDPGHLKSLKGLDFDLMFIDMMIPHHQGALVLSRDALARAQHPELRELAQRIIDAQQAEIAMMGQWQKEWKPAK